MVTVEIVYVECSRLVEVRLKIVKWYSSSIKRQTSSSAIYTALTPCWSYAPLSIKDQSDLSAALRIL